MDGLGFIADAGWVPIVCFIVGLGLVIFEMFNPGFGFPGFSGIALLILTIVFTADTLAEALVMIVIIIVILGVALVLVLRSAAKGRLSRTLILHESMKKEAGYIGSSDLKDFLGKEGTTLSVLRPSGVVEVDGVKLDVVSESEFVPKGVRVRVVQVDGPRIVVREISS